MSAEVGTPASDDLPFRIRADGADPIAGRVVWAPHRSLWIGTMTAATVLVAPFVATPGALAVFLAGTGLTLCLGHSIGMHRRLIHRSFECPLWLEYLCVYLGTLVGMCGPLGMIAVHDLRDWAQRQRQCHPYLRHGTNLWRDAWWQLHCDLELDAPPELALEPRIAQSTFYGFLERTWMLQQLPWAMLFFTIGGWPWVLWGICARVTVSVTGHWLVGHYAHNRGTQSWLVDGAAVQGFNVRVAAIVSMGESWHNNHHAFPESARLGLLPGQIDVGWCVILLLARYGLAWRIRTPADLPARSRLRALGDARARTVALRG
ncbi:MAG TPA: acyl-CoA desaturase [Pseudomonadales bacterium]